MRILTLVICLSMEITVPIFCSDGLFEFSYKDLTNFNCYKPEFQYQKSIDPDSSAVTYTILPLRVECTSIIFKKLLKGECIIFYPRAETCGQFSHVKDYKELAHLIKYNAKYGPFVEIKHGTYGFDCMEYFELLEAVKTEFPDDNVFSLLVVGGADWEACVLSKYCCVVAGKGELSDGLTRDLLEYVGERFVSSLVYNENVEECKGLRNCVSKCETEGRFLKEIERIKSLSEWETMERKMAKW